jgi:hypothetical protein
MPKEIYVTENGKPVGPYSVAQVNAMLTAKRLSPDDRACVLGEDEWMPLCCIAEIATVAPRNIAASSTGKPAMVEPAENLSDDVQADTPISGGYVFKLIGLIVLFFVASKLIPILWHGLLRIVP